MPFVVKLFGRDFGWETPNSQLLARLDVSQIERLPAMSKPAVARVAIDVLQNNHQLACWKPYKDLKLVVFDIGTFAGHEENYFVRVPRCSVKSHCCVFVLRKIVENKHRIGQGNFETVGVDSTSLETQFGSKLHKFIEPVAH